MGASKLCNKCVSRGTAPFGRKNTMGVNPPIFFKDEIIWFETLVCLNQYCYHQNHCIRVR